jgi:hypothetical protein
MRDTACACVLACADAMTPKQQREELSKAYVAAVAARAGCKLSTWSQDSGCLDVSVGTATAFGDGLAAPKLDLQLKASSKPRPVTDGLLSWSLKRSHFENLRRRAQVPHILVTLVLPEDEDEWMAQSAHQLSMRRCAYWVHLLGEPPIPTSQQSTTIRIPESQLFSPAVLLALLERSGRGEGIDTRLERP